VWGSGVRVPLAPPEHAGQSLKSISSTSRVKTGLHILLSLARAVLSVVGTPIIDGQNLGPFEASMVNNRSADVIVSEYVRAADALRDVVTLVNPYNVDKVLAALTTALSRADSGASRSNALGGRAMAKGYSLESWVVAQIELCGE
jgi:trehalose-6-phosphate synthase